MQAKPFISEAHVFNDAGLSFVVWPPVTGRPASDAPPQPPTTSAAEHPTCDSGLSSDPDMSDFVEHTCLAENDINTASLSNSSTVSTAAAAGDPVGVEGGMSRGYLLALKLWEEAVATVDAAHGSSPDLGR